MARSKDKYRVAFDKQKYNAKQRGISFKLTFAEWKDFWGSDIDRRGSGACDLQMQRFADQGAYELGNIRKGTPRQNALTRCAINANRRSEQAAARHQSAIDAMLSEPSPPPSDIHTEWDFKGRHKLGITTSDQRRKLSLAP